MFGFQKKTFFTGIIMDSQSFSIFIPNTPETAPSDGSRGVYGDFAHRAEALIPERHPRRAVKMRNVPGADRVIIPALKVTKGYRAIRIPFLIPGRPAINRATVGLQW